jgi:hypothetical protein
VLAVWGGGGSREVDLYLARSDPTHTIMLSLEYISARQGQNSLLVLDMNQK